MSVLKFDKQSLGNLEYSLKREMLATDRVGGYMSTTIVGCNTRKYHGLMVCPKDDSDANYVLLSSLDETVIQHDQSFNLAIHRYPGTYEPRGHKYITDFDYTPTPTITYRVGGVVLKKEILWIHSKTQLLVRYTLVEAKSDTTLRLRPFLAFRDKHALSQANMFADGHSYPAKNGVKCRLYSDFPWLYMQTDRAESEFVAAPDWYYQFEYLEEKARGYPYQEDLLTPGYFEINIKKGESVIFSAALDEMWSGDTIDQIFEDEVARRSDKKDFLSCLRHSARQFIARRGGSTEVIAGWPWFGRWGRDTFIALPGITLTRGDVQSCVDVLDTITSEMHDGMFPNMGEAYNSVDAPLWFFWTLQQLEAHVGAKKIWDNYGRQMKEVLAAYKRGNDGTAGGGVVAVGDNGLVWSSHPRLAMTWMDAVVDGRPVTGREGYQVEINALWYNAVCYTLELAKKYKDAEFIAEWKSLPERIKASFVETFWSHEKGYLADYVDERGQNVFVRPNQIIACSVAHKMLTEEQQLAVIQTVKRHLLTPKGLRTLSPQNPLYEGRYEGDQSTRDRAYHQGTVWPWPLEHYVKANFDLLGESFLQKAEDILAGFESDIDSYGIGSIAEIYDGDPPHAQRGAISQAWSVGAVLRINQMIEAHKAQVQKPSVTKDVKTKKK
ncbi:MAG: amylo-alpha-1,6-glucosidase [Rikenellaceae bacterium]|jgi:predicted glycogen debranching enzyme|nr:amylo-alpha-1,6-glucosidase [Rikenellaceae bacterium]